MKKKPLKIMIEVALIPVTVLLWIFLKLSEKKKQKKSADGISSQD